MPIGHQSKDKHSHCSGGDTKAQGSEAACPGMGLVSRRVETLGLQALSPPASVALIPQWGHLPQHLPLSRKPRVFGIWGLLLSSALRFVSSLSWPICPCLGRDFESSSPPGLPVRGHSLCHCWARPSGFPCSEEACVRVTNALPVYGELLRKDRNQLLVGSMEPGKGTSAAAVGVWVASCLFFHSIKLY